MGGVGGLFGLISVMMDNNSRWGRGREWREHENGMATVGLHLSDFTTEEEIVLREWGI